MANLKILYTNELAKSIYTKNPLKYETQGSAGMDIRAISVLTTLGESIDIESEGFILKPMQRVIAKVGFSVEFEKGIEVQIRSRSGHAFKNGVFVLNSPGTIDSDYRGEIGVILFNLGSEDFKINIGDRVAQMIVAKYELVDIKEVEMLENTARGSGGFGSTNK